MPRHTFTGQATTRRRRASGFSQASMRHDASTFDQHDRPWSMTVENSTGGAVGPLVPGFSAPWYPDPQYLIVNPDNSAEMFIDYPQMFRDRRAAMQEYHANALKLAVAKQWPTPTLGHYSDDIVSTLGAPPRALELVAAAWKENPWILGFSPTPDPRLVKYVEAAQPSSAIERELESYDFGADSYSDAVSALIRAPRRGAAAVPAIEDEDEVDGEGLDDETRAALDGMGDDDEGLRDLEDEPGDDNDGAPSDDPEAEASRLVKALEDEEDARVAREEQAARVQARRQQRGKPAAKKAAAKRPAAKKGPRKPWTTGRRTLADGANPGVADGGVA